MVEDNKPLWPQNLKPRLRRREGSSGFKDALESDAREIGGPHDKDRRPEIDGGAVLRHRGALQLIHNNCSARILRHCAESCWPILL